MNEWQPIETAPMTNHAILIWVPENRCAFCVTWSKDSDGREGWQIFGGGYLTYLLNASHWMPLPKPPKTENDE